MSSNEFWGNNINVLFTKETIFNFLPNNANTYAENLNAIVRFFIYLGIILSLLKSDTNYLLICLFGFFITFIVFNNFNVSESFLSKNENVVKPTLNNPFMNVLYGDDPERNPAANIEQDDIKKDMEKYFNHNLFKDVNDIWGKNNSQRQFYTTPSTTVPNDVKGFAEWLYGDKQICKDGDVAKCGNGDDLQLVRGTRNI
jgi:hypothetical protein